MAPKYAEWWERKGGTSHGWTHLLLGEEFCAKMGVVVRVEVGGMGEGTSVEHTYQQKKYV